MTADSKESVLRRWSRRKVEARDALGDEISRPAGEETDASALPAEPEPVLTDADMPPIESLTEESDFSPFMSKGVSEELRNLALRKLFHSQVFNIRDGLDEYDDDFTTFEKLGDIVTADMKHQIEMQQQKLREKLAAEGKSGEADTFESAGDDIAEEVDDDDADAAAAQIAASNADRDSPATPPDVAAADPAVEKKS